ncbi:glycosyltransferase family 9 protein [Mucilaginibacter sp.]|uniref:glycosyltransferase family 9 protein n=1 Tax=Mucilaginibacter sp. TaxID=1882438 RepID=UPI0035BBB490
MPSNAKPYHILISRTDAIGDVVLTLPMAAYLKEQYAGCRVSFLGRNYTAAVIKCCTAVDAFLSLDDITGLPHARQAAWLKEKEVDAIIHVYPNKQVARIARQAGIKLRIGTTNRIHHWFTCNKLVKLSRKKSELHEAQLNLMLLRPFGLRGVPSLADVAGHYKFQNNDTLPINLGNNLKPDKFNLILHPKSHGSGMEWGLNNFKQLIDQLPREKFNIIISGSDKEKAVLAPWIATLPLYVHDLTGKMSLSEFISLIFKADGLIASGTGPLHIAAASGIRALGLFPSLRPIHPGRWAPVGKQAQYLESGNDTLDMINVEDVFKLMSKWI